MNRPRKNLLVFLTLLAIFLLCLRVSYHRSCEQGPRAAMREAPGLLPHAAVFPHECCSIKLLKSWVWWHIPVILAFGRQGHADLCEFQASLCYTASVRVSQDCYMRLCLKKGRHFAVSARVSSYCNNILLYLGVYAVYVCICVYVRYVCYVCGIFMNVWVCVPVCVRVVMCIGR